MKHKYHHSFIRKLIPIPNKKTKGPSRFYDRQGLYPTSQFFWHGVICLFSWFADRLSLTLERPWIPIHASKFLKKIIPNKKIFEYGSGLSTFWLARLLKDSGYVITLEHDKRFYNYIAQEIVRLKFNNIKIYHATDSSEYVGYPRLLNQYFDLIIIDGKFRESCFNTALQCKPLFIYVDDIDQPEHASIQQKIHALVTSHQAKAIYFTDFVYHDVWVRSSVLIELL